MDKTRWSSGRSQKRSVPSLVVALPLFLLELLVTALVSPSPSFADSFPVDLQSGSEAIAQAESPPSQRPVESSSDSSMTSQPIQLDPLNSPHPIPWNWVTAMLSDRGTVPNPRFRYYRSQSLISPDGQYAAYSRIQMQLSADFTQSRVASVLFLENLATGDLQTITASSPFADNPFMADMATDYTGTIAILIPVAWSESGDRILAREFESIFGSDIASDFAVVWDRRTNRTHTIAPNQIQYSNAVLLGWSQTNPEQVLFRAGVMGQEEWPLYAVDVGGQTAYANGDEPMIFGRIVNSVWSGPQAYVQP